MLNYSESPAFGRQQLSGEPMLGLSDRYPWVNKGRNLGKNLIRKLQNI